MPLEKLGPYKLQKMLGRGGMGAVYWGLNEATGERAAVKVLSGHLADDGAFRERFKQEVETLKRLLHPNIVQLFGFGEEDGHLFYVMELVEGQSLQDELGAGRRFTWREVARIGVAVASALKHAHDRGIIHRDLKPANLLLDPQEQVKLTDFGIAKLYGGANVTADGGVLGTADYMAPEQAEGKPVTSRCDLYALGSVLFALLTGRPPFAGKSLIEVISALKTEPPMPVRRLAPDTPEEFEIIIGQLLEKDPQRRIPTALAVANRLKAMEHALSLETRVAPIDDGATGNLRLAPPANKPGPSAITAPLAPRDATAPLSDKAEPDYRIAGVAPTVVRGGGSIASAPTVVPGEPDDMALAAEEPAPRATRFTRVPQAVTPATDDGDEFGPKQWLLVGGLLLVSAVVIGGIVFFATRPPSADDLYRRVQSAQTSSGAEGLAAVADDLKQFGELYAGDPRAAEIAGWQEELNLYRLQKRFELQARRAGGDDALLPVERAYLAAVQMAASDPEQALARFRALVDVYSGPSDPNLSSAEWRRVDQCLTLARQQSLQLAATIDKATAQERTAVAGQMKRADQLAQDNRIAAEKIWRGIITLYAGKAWAKELVEQAQARLAPTK
ncbi:MAG: serine/threonine-protein kinase [Pirellulaceae bacterium]|nr:serine/threonine-protein kinase [Pirellulaceae bacterium]